MHTGFMFAVLICISEVPHTKYLTMSVFLLVVEIVSDHVKQNAENIIVFRRGSLYRLLHRPNNQLDERRRLRMALDAVCFCHSFLVF